MCDACLGLLHASRTPCPTERLRYGSLWWQRPSWEDCWEDFLESVPGSTTTHTTTPARQFPRTSADQYWGSSIFSSRKSWRLSNHSTTVCVCVCGGERETLRLLPTITDSWTLTAQPPCRQIEPQQMVCVCVCVGGLYLGNPLFTTYLVCVCVCVCAEGGCTWCMGGQKKGLQLNVTPISEFSHLLPRVKGHTHTLLSVVRHPVRLSKLRKGLCLYDCTVNEKSLKQFTICASNSVQKQERLWKGVYAKCLTLNFVLLESPALSGCEGVSPQGYLTAVSKFTLLKEQILQCRLWQHVHLKVRRWCIQQRESYL